ncbi:MAG TPA: hypothetical protein VHG30_09060 [Microvirga sp.]|nr:hypothetical protein [Microvirga sp.]
MPENPDKYVLDCPECGSHTFTIRGPTIEDAFVHCAECGAEVGQLDEFMMIVETRVERQEQERRKRRSH